ncbi:hypothetical protein COY31_02410 [Candidatus Wolfebacteria bacterium CG_4_10_14_0_2_um_filter_39_18]|uniref:Uncharacterized protein n=1 Tax=Candidatus Wolfebacteria bacterium CG_4_10_14_0_2_um_filter_39_18 TaxID=1975061 RepID=A0A2M7TFC6_9BACT|nr:MAG: hypothetical protein COY31_02410 [Candidatus Wolfebacteria bacterium CG_4_10_14_0_2_um_filter_39_18]
MPKRTKIGQKKHDNTVLKSAEWYENQGFKVKADLPGWEKPKKIGGFIPDLIAKKGKKEIIKEIETKDTNNKDVEQHEAFKEYTEKKRTREFKKKIV